MASNGSTSSNKKKANARQRANEKAADGGAGAARGRTSVREMSQGRYPGERPLTGEDRPADRKGGKAEGLSARPRGRQGVRETSGKTDSRPTSGRAKPGPLGRHPA